MTTETTVNEKGALTPKIEKGLSPSSAAMQNERALAPEIPSTPQPRAAILAMPEYHPPLAGRTALRLDFNENTHAPSPRVREALSSITLEGLTVYPERAPAEAVVAAHLGLQPEQVLLTNAVDEAIHIVCFTFLNPGDECLFAVPSFFMYDVNAMGMGATLVRIQADQTLTFPFERMLASITPKTKLIILTTPNNPTGAVITRDQIHTIAAAAQQAVILVDEAYFHFHGETVMPDLIETDGEPQNRVPHQPALSQPKGAAKVGSSATEAGAPYTRDAGVRVQCPRNILIARTFSKAYGLASLRVGLLAGPVQLMQHLRKASSPYNVNGVALAAVQACIGDTDYLDWYVGEMNTGRARIEQALDHMHVPRWPSHANFVLMHIGPRHKQFVAEMRARGVLVRDRSADPGLTGCVRITVGLPDQTTTGIAALRDTLAAMAWIPAEVNAPETTPKETPDYE